MIPKLISFPPSVLLTTEVKVHLVFFTVQKSVNLLFVKQCRFLLPTLPVTRPFYLRLLSKVAVPFRNSCFRLARTFYKGKFIKRGFNVCRIRLLNCSYGAICPSVLEIMINVSPPLKRQSVNERVRNRSATHTRVPFS